MHELGDMDEASLVNNDVVAVNGEEATDSSRDGEPQEPEPGHVGGLTVFTATVFLVGEMAGSGVLALPKALVHSSGWPGLLMIVLCCIIAGCNGVSLGRCWVMLRDNFPEYRCQQIRYPYPAIGEKAMGKPMSYVVTVAINLTLCGVSTVFLLLANQNIQHLLSRVNVELSYCYLIIITGTALIPFVCIGTPKDFWPIAVGALISTSVACLLIVIATLMDLPNQKPVPHTEPEVLSYFLTFGTILFAFGGAAIFPTIQHDMKEPPKFSYVVFSAYTILLAMYVPVSACGYFVYGDSTSDNILDTLPAGGLRDTADILLAVHLLLAFTIAVNPTSQQLEETFGIDTKFNWKRVAVRASLVMLLVFVGESIPHFGAILDFIGSSTITFLTFVAPVIFYFRLRYKLEGWESAREFIKKGVHPAILALNISFVVIGIIGGGISTYAAILELASKSTFIPPCYVNITAASHQ